MGRPYKEELNELPATYDWALNYDIAALRKVVREFSRGPLIAVGSGGSLSAAFVLTTLHQLFTGNLATVITPFELQRNVIKGHGNSICILTAGGGNVDVINALSQSIDIEPDHLAVLCASIGSKAASTAAAVDYIDFIEFPCPAGKDGFLATNSLLALSVLIGRAYSEEYGQEKFPRSFEDLFGVAGSIEETLGYIEEKLRAVLDREVITVLYGLLTKASAIDLESKFTEAALGVLHYSDYRNFAHGRHHWFAKRNNATGIFALADDSEYELASKTIALIPDDVPRYIVKLNHSGSVGVVEGLVWSLLVTQLAGERAKIDPGRPGVPEFGERIYKLSIDVPKPMNDLVGVSKNAKIAIERKTHALFNTFKGSDYVEYWMKAYDAYATKLCSAKYKAIVFDYDGTLVDEKNRFSPPRKSVIDEIKRLIDSGVSIGIATGRGQSVRIALQSELPEKHWDKVLIGYYNGAELGLLKDNFIPDRSGAVCSELQPVINHLHEIPDLLQAINYTIRKNQITLEPKEISPESWIWDMAQQLVQGSGATDVKVLRSSHSVDILAPSVSKLSVVSKLSEGVGDGFKVLTIGDRGKWPGNDYELLHEEFSLSVDEVSANPLYCWNMASSGIRGVQATLEYLGAITVDKSIGTLDNRWTRI